MFRRFILIIIIICEQIGILSPFSQKVDFFSFNFYQNNQNETFLEEISPLPYEFSQKQIDLEARAFISIDQKTAKVLASKEPNIRIPMASTTKIMTAIIVLENSNLDDIVTISSNAVSTYGQGISLRVGEKLTVENLLYAVLLNSSNDASVALAEFVASNEENFVKMMNKKAKELNLLGTHFTNASGLDNPQHFSTVYDLSLLSRYTLQNKKFREIVGTREKVINSLDGINHFLRNSNKLIGSEFNILGVKTGYTEEAGECLVALAERNNNEVLTVVLGSPDRFNETKKLLKWSFESFRW